MKRSTQNHHVRVSRAVAILPSAQLRAIKGGASSVAPTPVPYPPGPTVRHDTIVLDQ